MDNSLDWPLMNCQCIAQPAPPGSYCICGLEERALRAFKGGCAPNPMTPKQREWCLDEIGSVEGYERSDFEDATDANLATNVIGAWVDYCRDKGLL